MSDSLSANLYDLTALSVDGREVQLAQYRGKLLVIVNTASQCGFTPQYKGLEELYQQFKDRGLLILGFPCNQFGAQESGTEAEIARFCEINYSVTFPIFSKVDVNGPNAHPLFKLLKRSQGGVFGAFGFSAIKWNFTKFVIDRAGQPIARYAPTKTPAQLAPVIQKLL